MTDQQPSEMKNISERAQKQSVSDILSKYGLEGKRSNTPKWIQNRDGYAYLEEDVLSALRQAEEMIKEAVLSTGSRR